MGIVERNSRLANYCNTVTVLNLYKNIHNKVNNLKCGDEPATQYRWHFKN
jgi:hypothetical protein